eukprot:Skav216501  [mRNA]  locus=scaffold1123:598419:598984:+ [translate_table: standard]
MLMAKLRPNSPALRLNAPLEPIRSTATQRDAGSALAKEFGQAVSVAASHGNYDLAPRKHPSHIPPRHSCHRPHH